MISFITKIFNERKNNTMARTKLSKTAKIRNLFAKGAAMVGKLRNEGMMIYENRSTAGVSYRVGTPSKAIIAAGITKVFGKQVAYAA